VVPASGAELLDLQPVLVLLLVFCRRVVAVLAVTALQSNDFAHHSLLVISFQPSVIGDQQVGCGIGREQRADD
jgi:hypothetical protein